MYLRVFACKLFVLWPPEAEFGQHVHRQHQRQTWLTHHWCGRFWPLVHARIAMYALFVALAMVTSFIEFPITPVTWLKYDRPASSA